MANKSLKTIKFPGLDDTYTIPQSYSDVGAASAAHTHTAADIGAVPTSRTVNGKSLNSDITLSASDVGALPTTTHIPNDQVNSDWNATAGVSSILNKPTIPAAQVNANWTATTGVASILNKPSLAAVATTGSYNSLTDKPTIPAAQVNSNWTATTGVASILNKPAIPSTYSDVGAASAAHTHTYSDVGAASAAHTHTAADVGAVPTSRTVNGKSLNANITLSASDVGALPTSTHIPADQVNADWTATTGVTSILNKPSIPAAQVNANWTATTGVASILNKPSIPSTYSDVGAASAAHTHTYSDVGAMSAGTQVVHSVTVTPNFTSGQKIAEITVDSTTASVYAPEGTVQVNADWNASTGVASILNKPSIPAAQVNANWTATTGVASILNKPSIPSSAADVGAVPTSRTVNGKSLNANITLSASDVGALSADTHIPADQVNADWNASSGVSSILNKPTIPVVPTNVSAFTNDAGYLTSYTETDPVFGASAAAGISAADVSNWNAKPGQMCWYGTCDTTASTSAKVVTCEGFELKVGAIIGILFSTANTAATPTLNVNGTGAVSIIVGGSTPNSTTNVLKWSTSTTAFFMYNGTYFRLISIQTGAASYQPRGAATWYGTCSTTATTTAKTATVTNFVLTTGALVTLGCSTANTVTNAAITLNVNSTGAKTIYVNRTATSSSNTLTWDANEVLTFMYNGTGYYLVAKGAKNISDFVNDAGYVNAAGASAAAPVQSVNGQTGTVSLSASDVGALSASTTYVTSASVNASFSSGQKLADIVIDGATTSIYAPEGTVQVNADWNASTGVSSILNKPSIPAAQVNSDWNASTGLSSILNKPSIPSTYSDVGAASASHGHGNISNDGKIADTGFLPGTPLTLIAADSTGTIALGPSITGSTGDANKYLSDKGTFETVPAAQVNANWTATTGVSSILNKPTIPAAQVNSNWTATTGVSSILNKPSSMTPTAHASTATTYGQGTSSNYGHVKLSDSISSTSSAASGIAATPSAVKTAYDLANTANGKATTAGNLASSAQSAANAAGDAAEAAQDSATNALDKLGTQTNIEVTIATGSTSVLNFSSTAGTRGILFFNGYSLNTKGAYIVTCATNGTVQAQPILAASDLTLTTGTRKLTIKNNSTASGAYGIFMRFAGSFTIS